MAVLVLASPPRPSPTSRLQPRRAAGGFGKAVFRVPTESETASTTKIRVTLPEDTPFAFVSAQPKPGWKVTSRRPSSTSRSRSHGTTLSKAVRTVTWTRPGDGIPPGEFDEFALSLGQFPEVKTLAFAAEQTYGDGEVVAWDQEQKGDKEPEHPAPTLELAQPATTRPPPHRRSESRRRTRTGRMSRRWRARGCAARRCGCGPAESTSCVTSSPWSPPWSCSSWDRGRRRRTRSSSGPTPRTGRQPRHGTVGGDVDVQREHRQRRSSP